MKKFIKTLCTMAVLTTANQAAAESFQLGVTGTMTPTACTPSLENNGTVDYGVIKSDSLSKDDYTRLEDKNITLNISCTSLAKVALLGTSGRKGSALGNREEGLTGSAGSLINLNMPDYAGVVGFGMDGEKKIGAYGIQFGQLSRDGDEAKVIRSGDKSGWSYTNANSLFHGYGYVNYISLDDNNVASPGAFITASFPLIIKGYINKASELDISKPIKLDGLTNIEMVYL
ncbi:DUF1120 domain-containing protein [Pantoea dispersa]|uniref:DUF1120 domain-containing protein n=1 Tax=Pantoea dispersa TaxID=59814 RepID=UPI000797224B|nr:DUF1120 domain-containing protein [Pantoea dispersa]KTS32429.1 hypothetical protein NS389_17390 [Pantoea dispersa]KTS63013.1 hypothetical protein NS380_00440 [Pantoea dispersa]